MGGWLGGRGKELKRDWEALSGFGRPVRFERRVVRREGAGGLGLGGVQGPGLARVGFFGRWVMGSDLGGDQGVPKGPAWMGKGVQRFYFVPRHALIWTIKALGAILFAVNRESLYPGGPVWFFGRSFGLRFYGFRGKRIAVQTPA